MSKFIEHRIKMRIPKKDVLVFYHSNCTDGFSGAWAAWKKFGDKAEYVPWTHQTPLPPLKGKELYFIDICPKEDEVRRLLAANRRVTAIDHHVSAEAAVKLTDRYSYALDHSGAMLAWAYFHPTKLAPKLLRYVEDHDLFLKKMPHTEAVHAYLDLFNFEFRLWSRFAREFEKKSLLEKHVAVGKLILKHEQKLVARVVSTAAVPVMFFGIRTLAVNSPLLGSEIAYALYTKKPPLGIVWYEREGQIKVSLRSNGTVNVAKLAEKFGGGGHKAAAGFAIPVGKKPPWERL